MSLFSLMNDKQKIFLIVGVSSLAVLVATGYHYSFNGHFGTIFGGYWGTGAVKDFKYHTNWLAFIAIANIFASLVGWFIFKDK